MQTFAEVIVDILYQAGCIKAFGVSGNSILPLWKALDDSDITTYHCRHETGAAFAAGEHSLHTDELTAVFTTAGPGISNAITGLRTVKADGGKVVLLAALTAPEPNGPMKLQETTTAEVMSLVGPTQGLPLNEAVIVRDEQDLLELKERVRLLAQSPKGGCLGVFTMMVDQKRVVPVAIIEELRRPKEVEKAVLNSDFQHHATYLETRLERGNLIIWAGFGCHRAAADLRRIAEIYQAPVIVTPRAKGIFPETHPLYMGVSGPWSTYDSEMMQTHDLLVLGTRLGEYSSFHVQLQQVPREVTCVNIEPENIKRNFPAQTTWIRADINDLLPRVASGQTRKLLDLPIPVPRTLIKQADESRMHPVRVMQVVQDIAVNTYNAEVMCDAGNSLFWTSHHLSFLRPHQFHISLLEGSMGFATAGAIGLGASGTPVLAVVGDGAMLMQNEVNTAVRYGMPVIWLVMNDTRYNMCFQVAKMLNTKAPDCRIPEVDFALLGKAYGARSHTATTKEQLEVALREGFESKMPTVIDVLIDPDVTATVQKKAKVMTWKASDGLTKNETGMMTGMNITKVFQKPAIVNC